MIMMASDPAHEAEGGPQPDPRLLHGTPEDVFIYLCSFIDHCEFVCQPFLHALRPMSSRDLAR